MCWLKKEISAFMITETSGNAEKITFQNLINNLSNKAQF